MTTMPLLDDRGLLNKQLKRIFGHAKFYSTEQEEATRAVLQGNKDVYINLQPGAGKSLCFQLPTVLKPFTVTVVFVPTNCLAKDHMDFLKRRRIKAEYLHAGMHKDQCKVVLDKLETDESKFQFLYVSLDKNSRDVVKKLIIKLNDAKAMAYIVFDEAHCISRLSHDYMPAYKDVAKLMRKVCSNIPKIALTGTATAEVKRDIIAELGMKEPLKFSTSSYRPVVYHDVQFMDMLQYPIVHLSKFIQETIGSLNERHSEEWKKCGIIFCRQKRAVETIARKLGDMNIPVVTYHGDLLLSERKSIHERWTAGEIPIIAATHQFGIGLHRHDVTFVVHWGTPMTFQQLFQEAGRVNGDGRKAYCRVYFSCEEETNIITQIKSILRKTRSDLADAARQLRFFQEVINYCLQTECRHVTHAAYFGRTVGECRESCDACREKITQQRNVENFFRYREWIKKAMVDILALKRQKLDSTVVEKAVPFGCARDAKETAVSSRSKLKLRERSYRKLLAQLRINYDEVRLDFEHHLNQKDICEAARQLEYSLYIGTNQCQKYYHDVNQKIEIIRKCTKSKLGCGYLKFYGTQPFKNPESYNSQAGTMLINLREDELTIAPADDVPKSEQRHVDENITMAAESFILQDTQMEIDFVEIIRNGE